MKNIKKMPDVNRRSAFLDKEMVQQSLLSLAADVTSKLQTLFFFSRDFIFKKTLFEKLQY